MAPVGVTLKVTRNPPSRNLVRAVSETTPKPTPKPGNSRANWSKNDVTDEMEAIRDAEGSRM